MPGCVTSMNSVPMFAGMPQFEFLRRAETPQLSMPPTMQAPQRSTIEGPLRSQIDDFRPTTGSAPQTSKRPDTPCQSS